MRRSKFRLADSAVIMDDKSSKYGRTFTQVHVHMQIEHAAGCTLQDLDLSKSDELEVRSEFFALEGV